MPEVRTAPAFLQDQNGTGSADMNVTGSVATPVFFDYLATRGTYVYSMSLAISSGPVRIDKFGDLPALENGLLFQALDPDLFVVFDLLGEHPVRANQDISVLAGQGFNMDEKSGMGSVRAEWAPPRRQLLPEGYRLRITVQDALQDLGYFRMFIGVDIG